MIISSTDCNVIIRWGQAWTATDRISAIWKSNLSDKIKREFYPSEAMSVLLYNCTVWTFAKYLVKKPAGMGINIRKFLKKRLKIIKQDPYGIFHRCSV